ncbi:MAG TPA: hypothetical protein DCZ91_18570 [Lachnospiraceae bacterium]|nr:hypothetical protein [Lachnospiraceae bacterium]
MDAQKKKYGEKQRMKTKNEKKRTGKYASALVLTATVLFLSGCTVPFPGKGGNPSASPAPEQIDTGFVVPGPESFDSADTAILVEREEEKNELTFLNLDLGRRYTLSMDGTTRLYDRYGKAISIAQIQKGDIVDITFLKSKKHLTTMQLSAGSWTYNDVAWYKFDTLRGEVTIGEEVFKLTSNTQYLSEGRNIELMDLNAADILNFQGIGSQVLSVRVERGHGYLRLVNGEKFVGGWIEIGEAQIQRITDDMLLLVPEGSYQVNITNKGGGGVKNVEIARNEETILDIGDLEIPEPQTGTVLFSLTPSDAELYIDGVKADASRPVTLEYGLHQIIVRADGYQSITQYIRVAQESASFDIVMEAAGTDIEEDESSTEPDVTTAPDPVTDYYKVYIDAPEGVEVYLDGHYVGISPCSFRKAEGSHVIILRKEGYETRSYTVQIDDAEKDMSYSFADLLKYGSETGATTSPTPDTGAAPTPDPTSVPAPVPESTPEPSPASAPESAAVPDSEPAAGSSPASDAA